MTAVCQFGGGGYIPRMLTTGRCAPRRTEGRVCPKVGGRRSEQRPHTHPRNLETEKGKGSKPRPLPGPKVQAGQVMIVALILLLLF